jgi:SAM-dependent MidA family methyltransferase
MAGLATLHFDDVAEITATRQKEMRAFQTLMHPNLMGASFKAICFSKGVTETGGPLSGLKFGGDAWERLR